MPSPSAWRSRLSCWPAGAGFCWVCTASCTTRPTSDSKRCVGKPFPAWAQKGFPTHRFESLVGLVVHEAVHTQQKPAPAGQQDNLLRHALGEGIADFLAELAVGPWNANAPRQIYGRAHEHDVWVDFQDEMEIAGDSIIRMWMYNGMMPPDKNHGAVDIGYWVGYRIAGAYYARASDKRAAVRELLELRDAEAILRASGYAP